MEPVEELIETPSIYPALLGKPVASYDFDANRMEVIEANLKRLREGTVLWKVRSFTSWYRRLYLLDDDRFVLRYEPSHKPGCYNHQPEIRLDDILDVRRGWKTDTFNKIGRKVEKQLNKSPEMPPAVREDCCFSVVYGDSKQTLDLVAPDAAVADLWVQGLNTITDLLKKNNREDLFNRWLKQQFEEADLDKSGELNFDECCQLLLKLNVKMTKGMAKKTFDKANTNKFVKNGDDVLDIYEFRTFFYELMTRLEIMELFSKYALPGCENEMDVDGLLKFLINEQKIVNMTKQDCIRDIDVYEQSSLKESGRISPLGFTNMLMSEKHEILNFEHRLIYQDLRQPLTHYYIASSHNTYLTGGQLKGESSLEGYIGALNRGCRCVELDCWDGPDGEPIIYHGYTLTTKILFKDVLTDAIKPFAFKASQFPVILSLENHCGEEQQKIMARHLRDILKNEDNSSMLYSEEVQENMEFLPSPEDLKMKIIIKAKKISSSNTDKPNDCQSSGEEEEEEKSDEKDVAEDLSNLVNLCQSVHFQGFDEAKDKGKCYQMSSFAESKATKLIQSSGSEFVDYNRRQFSRIYPAGSRTGSSNFHPIPFWNVGCQIVALNYQSSKQPIFINEAKFRTNGGCGYLLKPQFLREKMDYNPKTPMDSYRKILKLRIISGQFIPKADPDDVVDVVDPYVKVEILGHPDDNLTLKTKTIKDNGFNPQWNHEMRFELKMPDLAMICIAVKDESTSGANGTLGLYALPITSLSEGYRHIYLMDYSRKRILPTTLFVHVSISNWEETILVS